MAKKKPKRDKPARPSDAPVAGDAGATPAEQKPAARVPAGGRDSGGAFPPMAPNEGDEGRHAQIQQAKDHLAKFVGHLNDERRKQIEEAAYAVFNSLTIEAIKRFNEHTHEYAFFNDLFTLNKHSHPTWEDDAVKFLVQRGRPDLGYFDNKRKELVMDGPGTNKTVQEIFAHEAAHAITSGEKFTGTRPSDMTPFGRQWRVFWGAEMTKLQSRDDAGKKPYEGIAHLLHLWYGGKVSRERIKARYPKCCAFLASKGLI